VSGVIRRSPSLTPTHCDPSIRSPGTIPLLVGRSGMPLHALRHYGLTRFAQAGAATCELLARAGHSNITVAPHYQYKTGRDAELAAWMAQLSGIGLGTVSQ